ncbi:MAG: serine hydrolase [Romboutsia sp.]
MKKVISSSVAFILAFLTFFSFTNVSFANNNTPSISAEFAVLMDYETGKVLYDKNSDKKLYPASTTKIWTAYIVLKNVSNLNQVIKIENMPAVEGSSMYLKDGESFTIKELLDSLLIHSSNDVAVVLANYISGSIEKFAELMNSEAKAIGTKNTHFTNPHGLPDENHYTTAYDMALMARESMSNKIFREIVKTPSIKYKATEAYPYERYFLNTNKFLGSKEKINYRAKEIDINYDIVDGIKTGFTDDAGKCLLSSAVKDNMRVISAVFKSSGNELYLDSRTIIDYGLENFTNSTVVDKSKLIDTIDVKFTKQGKLVYEPLHSYKVVLSKGNKKEEYKTKVNLDKINLPIKKGDKVGNLEVYKGNVVESTIDLVATDNLDSSFSFITENKLISNILKITLVALVLLVIIFIYLVIAKKIRKKNKSHRKNKNIYRLDSKMKKRRR